VDVPELRMLAAGHEAACINAPVEAMVPAMSVGA
jgi:hypothetical protein